MSLQLQMFLALMVMAAQERGRVEPAVEPAIIQGVVTEFGTGEPLQDAHVAIVDENNKRWGAMTDKDGRFVISNVPAGRYTITASRTGFSTSRHKNPSSNFTISANQLLPKLHLQMDPTGAISGRILDQNGQPRSRIRIQALRYRYFDGRRTLYNAGSGTETDDRGEYRIFGLEPGDYYVRAMPGVRSSSELRSAAPLFYPGVTEPQYAAPVVLTAGAEVNAIDFSMVAGNDAYAARFRIVKAIADVPNHFQTMRFSIIPHNSIVIENTTTQCTAVAADTYNCPLAPGSYDIFAWPADDPNVQAQSGRLAIDIVDRNVDAGTMVMRIARTVRGQLTLEGAPSANFSNVRVAMRPGDGTPSTFAPRAAIVAEDGTFTIYNIREGRYHLTVIGLPSDVYISAARYGSHDVLHSALNVEGEPSGDLSIRLSGSAGRIDGVVRDDRDRPVTDSTVVLIPPAPLRMNSASYKVAFTDQSGHFSIRGVPPGDYGVLAWEQVEPGAYENPEFLGPFERLMHIISVEPGARKTVDLRAIPPRSQ